MTRHSAVPKARSPQLRVLDKSFSQTKRKSHTILQGFLVNSMITNVTALINKSARLGNHLQKKEKKKT